jgi:hypothetical protein
VETSCWFESGQGHQRISSIFGDFSDAAGSDVEPWFAK